MRCASSGHILLSHLKDIGEGHEEKRWKILLSVRRWIMTNDALLNFTDQLQNYLVQQWSPQRSVFDTDAFDAADLDFRRVLYRGISSWADERPAMEEQVDDPIIQISVAPNTLWPAEPTSKQEHMYNHHHHHHHHCLRIHLFMGWEGMKCDKGSREEDEVELADVTTYNVHTVDTDVVCLVSMTKFARTTRRRVPNVDRLVFPPMLFGLLVGRPRPIPGGFNIVLWAYITQLLSYAEFWWPCASASWGVFVCGQFTDENSGSEESLRFLIWLGK